MERDQMGTKYIFATGDKDAIPDTGDRRFFIIADGPGEVQAAFVGDQPLCVDCLQFGTICRPCRKERYEAGLRSRQRAERSAQWRRVRTALYGGLAVLAFLMLARTLLDRSCGAGHRWNGETLVCEPRR